MSDPKRIDIDLKRGYGAVAARVDGVMKAETAALAQEAGAAAAAKTLHGNRAQRRKALAEWRKRK